MSKEIAEVQVFGNEKVLTYLNTTSAGQSGGAVIQHKTIYGFRNIEKILIGIHVSGYLRQSKCTLFVKPNLDWMKSIFSDDKSNLYQTKSWQHRMIDFIDQFEQNKDETCLEIIDLECLTVICKYIGVHLMNYKFTELKVNLKLRRIK